MAVPAHVNAASALLEENGSRRWIVRRRRRRRGGARRPRLRGSGDGFGDGRRAARDEKRDGSRAAPARAIASHVSRNSGRCRFTSCARLPGRMASVDGVLAVARPSVLIPTRVASATSVTTGWLTNAASTPTRRQADVSHGKRHNARSNPASRHPRRPASPSRHAHHEGDTYCAASGARRALTSPPRSPTTPRMSLRANPLASTVMRTSGWNSRARLVASFSLRRSRGNRDAISHAPIAERSSIGKSDEGRPAAIVAGPPTPATARTGSPRAAASVRSAARNPPARTSPEGSPARIHTRSVRRETKSDEHVNGKEDEGS